MEGEPDVTGISKDEIAIFHDDGLDYKEWFPQMKKAFGIDNTKLMKHVSITIFDDFLDKIKSPQKEALRSVLDKMTGLYTKQRETKEKEKELEDKNLLKTAKDEKEVKEMAKKERKEKESEQEIEKQKLETSTKNEQQKAREAVKRVNDEILANLDKFNKNEPSDFGQSTYNKDDIARYITDATQANIATPGCRINWTAAETIRNIQGGILCKGIYLSENLDELLTGRETVIDVKDNLIFKGPISAVETCRVECSSYKMTQTFQNNTDKSSSSKAFSGNFNFYGVGLGGDMTSGQNDETEKETRTSREETYLSVMHCEKVPVKSIDMSRHELTLQPHAVENLKSIEEKIKRGNYKSRGQFQEFFTKYGSHTTHGVIELGGILMSTASHQGFKESERSKIRHISSDVSETSLNIGFSKFGFGANLGASFAAKKLQGQTTGKYEMKELESIEVSLKKIGGPEECYDKMDWRKGLVANTSLWRIVNRESRPIPLWDLLEKVKDKFENYTKLANAMEREWKKNVSTKNSINEEVLNSLRRDMNLWQQFQTSDDEGILQCVNSLAKIRSKHVISNEDWFEEVLYQPVVQETLRKATEIINKKDSSQKQLKIATSLRAVLHPSDQIKTRYFKNIIEITNVINGNSHQIPSAPFDISSIVELPQILQDAVKELDLNLSSKDEVSKLRSIALRLESTMIVNKTNKPDFHFLVCLAILHLHGFSIEEELFSYHLDKADIQNIVTLLEESIKKIDSASSEKIKQALLLDLAMKSPHQKQATVSYMINKMPGGIDSLVGNTWEKSNKVGNGCHFESIHTFINEHLINENSNANLGALVQSLNQQFQSILQGGQDVDIKEQDTSFYHLDGPTEKLLEKLNLKQHYPQKLTYDDVIMLTTNILKDDTQKPNNLTELPWYFLRQVISLNSNIRENVVEVLGFSKCERERNVINVSPIKGKKQDEWEEDWEDDGTHDKCTAEENKRDDALDTVHPLDIVCAVFLCADDFLRQELVDKMSKCQYAVPFILPSPHRSEGNEGKVMLYWALKSITRMFQVKDKVDLNQKVERGKRSVEEKISITEKHANLRLSRGKTRQKTMVDVKGPLVSCLSVGKETTWKLKLLNKMLSPQQETFWHQGLAGGHCQQMISQGLAEIAWYLPGGDSNDNFTEPVGFINFRDNALDCSAVSDTLIQSSSVSCVFTSEVNRDLFCFLKGNCSEIEKIVLVVLYKYENQAQIKKGCNQLQSKLRLSDFQLLMYEAEDANFDTAFKKLKKSLQLLTEKNHTSVSELVSTAKLTSSLGSDDKKCRRGYEAAMGILTEFDEYNRAMPSSAKSIILPCQSDIDTRKEMGQCDKEICRQKDIQNANIERYKLKIKNRKWKLQLRQLQYPISPTFIKFLQCILTFRGSNRKYFLQSLKFGLNERSIELLQPWREKYQACQLQKESVEKEEALSFLGTQLTHGSLELDHFFREMAVLYENIAALCKIFDNELLKQTLDALSGAMAELFLEGIAVEILDGDVVHSPVLWLKAVLNKVENNAEIRVFKTSVLGAQSSGKSTILNTAFGLSFPVSGGRCTRGAFMQLVKFNNDFCQTLKCNYLLVIDSEGLMSRVITNRSDFDNELATFVIGLSDLTLVIIKGEGNEMQDVLPIAIHVLLRMNKVTGRQACHFVHQNMGAVDVEDTSLPEIDAFVQMLDEKTLAAAKNTEQSHIYTHFTDVLLYDKVNDNTFVPGLWNGKPPMGKTDIQYATKMQDLKRNIILHIKDVADNKKENTTLHQFGDWLGEIWRAIKYENFVFSFKNVFAIEAYDKLTKYYDGKQLILKNKIVRMIEEEETLITNSAMQKGVSFEENIKSGRKKIENKIVILTSELRESIKNCFPCEHEGKYDKDCCIGPKISNLQIDNKKEFEDNANRLQRELVEAVHARMDALNIKIQTEIHIQDLSENMDETLIQRVQTLVREQKSKNLGEAEMKHIFNEMWTNATGDIMKKVMSQDMGIDIRTTVQNTVIRLLQSDQIDYLYREAQDAKMIRSQEFNTKENHLKTRGKVGNYFGPQVSRSDYEALENEIKQILLSTGEVFKLSPEGKRFVETDAETFLCDIVRKLNMIKIDKVVITKHLKVDLLMYLEDRVVEGFTAQHDRYVKRSSPAALLEKKKNSYLILFENKMGQGNTAVDFCNNSLKKIVVRNVEKRLSDSALLEKLKLHSKDVFGDLRTLQASIMVDLYKAKDFDKYREYISQYEFTVKQKMTQTSIECLEKKDLLKNLAKTHLQSLLIRMDEAVNEAIERCSQGGNFVKIFFEHLSDFWISHEEITAYYNINIRSQKEVKHFGKLILDQLGGPVRQEVEAEIDEWSIKKKIEERNLTNYLFNEIVTCKERCPFCKAPCDKHSGGRKGGDHSVTLHRPRGLGGVHMSQARITRDELMIGTCPAALASSATFWHTEDGKDVTIAYSKYRYIHPDWQILPNAEFESEKYWKYVFAKYNRQWAEYYNAKPALLEELGPEWMNYTDEDFRKDMDKYYHCAINI